MANIDLLTAKLNQKVELNPDFFDYLAGPPVSAFFNNEEHEYIKKIILRNRTDMKFKIMNAFMKGKGFSRLSAGTNRIVYRYLEDPSFVLKVAFNKVGMQDSTRERMNQVFLKPFVCKIFDVTQDGLMATAERVLPITSTDEFDQVQDLVYRMLTEIFIGEYVADDVGKFFFRNYGIRPGFGPVLLDFPYFYKIDPDKLLCNKVNPNTGLPCNGLIDYDDGLNFLICTRCGKRYFASDLEDKNAGNHIIINKGGLYPMKIMTRNNGIEKSPIVCTDYIADRRRPEKIKSQFKIAAFDGHKKPEVVDNSTKTAITETIPDMLKNIDKKLENITVVKEDVVTASPVKEEVITPTDEEPDNTEEVNNDDDRQDHIEEPSKDIPETTTKKSSSKSSKKFTGKSTVAGKANVAGKASLTSKFITDSATEV